MVFQWKIPGIMPVDAQTAGEELHRIYQARGRLDAPDIVEESRPEAAPLHPCFEWDDEVAAEKYREHQAQGIVRAIVVEKETGNQEPVAVRAFVRAEETYRPIEVVFNSDEQTLELLAAALAELKAFQRKYKTLAQLAPVFDAIAALTS